MRGRRASRRWSRSCSPCPFREGTLQILHFGQEITHVFAMPAASTVRPKSDSRWRREVRFLQYLIHLCPPGPLNICPSRSQSGRSGGQIFRCCFKELRNVWPKAVKSQGHTPGRVLRTVAKTRTPIRRMLLMVERLLYRLACNCRHFGIVGFLQTIPEETQER